MTVSSYRGLVAAACLWLCAVGCGGDSSSSPPIDPSATETSMTMTDPTIADTGSGTSDMTTGSGSSTGAANCDDIVCTGHGACIEENGFAACVCDPGYKLNLAGDECVVDESCIQMRFLEDHCRQIVNGPPAVALFYGVDFCSGTAVTAEKVEELGLEFVVLENGVDISENVESEATIIEKDVESYVTLVIDMSDSIAESEDLPDLFTELRALVAALEPAAGEPDVYVSVWAFGRFVEEYIPFTRDLGAVDTALADLSDDPSIVVVGQFGSGTALFHAVEQGINETQRIRELRDGVTKDGVLSTGTIVVVTDGKDTSNAGLNGSLISGTTNQVISIGISSDVDDADLADIGRDGSFLAPTPADWTTAFAEIAQRVDEYPDRAYLLAYCSSATDGSPGVTISVAGEGLVQVTEAGCNFDADAFSSDPLDVCDADLFATNCDSLQCGGLTACGGCDADECCAGGSCIAPMSADEAGVGCDGQHDLCDPADQVCNDEDFCQDPAPPGTPQPPPDPPPDPCDPACEPGAYWCLEDDSNDPVSCEPTLPLGSSCEFADQCESLNCYFVDEDNPAGGRVCLKPARIFDHCGSQDAVCEKGSYCQGSNCIAKKRNLVTCGSGRECRNAVCEDFGFGKICAGPSACFWSWDEKVPG